MQLARVSIANFKGIKEFEHSWLRPWDNLPRPLTLLLGANGSGKTTILQAIALTLSLATRRTPDLASFNWAGFLPGRLASHGAPRVELDVRFDQDELDATARVFALWAARAPAERVRAVAPPSQVAAVTLILDNGALHSPAGPEAVSQFLGRSCVSYLLRTEPGLRREFAALGGVFWFDQNRNLASIEDLRKCLVDWWAFHTSPGRTDATDYLAQLERLMQRVFPGTRFRGVDLPQGAFALDERSTPYVLLERAGQRYDISEMSSGEQAVFPVMYEFARLNIARSVVLIDELELHLHPPEQQTLIAALREIGPDCQFIATSHSPYLEEVTPDDDEIRLEGGLRCL